MKHSIPKNNTYKDVSASELQTTSLTLSEKDAVYKLIRQLNRSHIISTYLAFSIALVFLFITLYNIKLNGINGYGGMFIFIGLFLAVGLLSSRQLISPHAKYKKAQHGILNGTWSSTAQSRRNRTYYMDVIFPATNTRCRKVVCCHRDYLRAQSGDQILVVSFNMKKAYGVILSSF